jgi:lipopolysaccharide/colanic/teichoic acid biosynthesis glycosyltransferase
LNTREPTEHREESFQVRIKYFFDRFFAFILLMLLSPLFLIIALAIYLNDRGSVFFKHPRPGLNARSFKVWKFRSMVENADRLLKEGGSAKGLDRVTGVGKILRKTSLDELPQLINILKGDMSFIGPRPALMEHLERYTEEQKERFRMKPGVTGLAQVSGRNVLKWSKRIEFDRQYIDNYSLWLDIKILFKTVKVVLCREGISLDRNVEEVDDLGPPRA